MSKSNGTVAKWIGIGITIIVISSGALIGYAKLGSQVEINTVDIEKGEVVRDKMGKQVDRMDVRQQVMQEDIKETRQDVKELLRRIP